VTWLKGHAKFTGANGIDVAGTAYSAKNIVIATGSSVSPLKGVEVDQERIVDSTGALELAQVPQHLVVIGGGVIGLELGSVWKRLGAQVTVVEFLDQILPGMDADVRKDANRIFKKQGFTFRLGTKVTGVQRNGAGVTLTVEPAKGGAAETIEASHVLLSIGRRPNTDGLNLDAAGVRLNNRGQIEVDHDFRTGVPASTRSAT
jgi:dihydrolipoamide dehydrogenase